MRPPSPTRALSPCPHRRARLWAALLAIGAYGSLGSEFGAWHPGWLCAWLAIFTIWVFIFRHSERDMGATFLAGSAAFFAFALGSSLPGYAVGYVGSLVVLWMQVGWVVAGMTRTMFE